MLLNGEWVKENVACARAAVRSKIAVDLSRGGVMIETQHSAEPDSALNGAVRPNCGLFRSAEFRAKYPDWAQPLRVHAAVSAFYVELP